MADYEPLPLKYRPRDWTDLVGQEHAVLVLRKSLEDGRVFHSYIFCGVAGSGKTSAARIFAMALNCEKQENGNPCLECNSCTSALAFKNPDVVEIDGPSHGSVAHVRDLRQRGLYSPTYEKRVFIIDEVHSLSRDAFEALLKILEEPPSHVVFILATTNPEKIPATIHSRSITLDFRRHTESDVNARLRYVAESEGVDLTPDAAEIISRYADGSLRDSLTHLDQLVTAHGSVELTADLCAQTLGVVSGTELLSIMEKVLARDAPGLERVLLTTLERTTEFGLVVRAITDWYRDVLRYQMGADVQRSGSENDLIASFADVMNPTTVEQAIKVTWEMADRVKYSSSAPRTFFLTGLYRLMMLTDGTVMPQPDSAVPPPADERVPVPTQATGATPSFKQKDTTDLEAELAALEGRE
jgi:DNA polymerase-3 subunit gamma/tau